MYSTSDFRKGLKIELDNKPYIIVDFQHVKPGKGGAFVRTKLKNMGNRAVVDKTFKSGESVGKPDLEEKKMQFLYRQDKEYYFLDTETYEQIFLEEDFLKEQKDFLADDIVASVVFYKGNPIEIEFPIFVEIPIKKTDPGLKGDTASGGSKPAVLETGGIIQVPLFINESDVIKIDTRSREYVERVKST